MLFLSRNLILKVKTPNLNTLYLGMWLKTFFFAIKDDSRVCAPFHKCLLIKLLCPTLLFTEYVENEDWWKSSPSATFEIKRIFEHQFLPPQAISHCLVEAMSIPYVKRCSFFLDTSNTAVFVAGKTLL